MASRREGISLQVGALAIAISIFAVGGAPRWGQAAVAIGIAIALAPFLRSRRVLDRLSPLVLMLGLAIVMTAIQVMPLPHGVVEWLSPIQTGLRDDGAALANFDVRSTITADVPATLRALVFFITLLGVAIVGLRISSTENGRYRVLAGVATLCGLAGVVGDLHNLLGFDKLYGVIAPQMLPRILGPLFNSNHFACLMAIGAVVAMGLVTYRRQRSWLRVVWLATVLVCSLTCLATLSRGGSIALAAGAFVVVGTIVTQRWLVSEEPLVRRSRFLTSSLPIGVVAISTVVVVLYTGAEGIEQQLSATSFSELQAPRSKFAAWRSAATLVDETPWVGIGRGALEPVFVRVHPASAFATFPYLENEYVEAVVDFGVPGALLLALATIWFVIVAIRRWRDGPLVAASLGAIAVVMLQSNVDFGLELLGIAAPITAIATTLAYVPVREESGQRLAVAHALRIVHVLALIGGALLLFSSATTMLDEDHHALGRDVTLDKLQPAFKRHPLDYYNYALAAQVMAKAGDRKAVQLLNHALILHPTHPGLHLMAARMLFASGHASQAAVEYAIALPAATDRKALIAEIVKRFPQPLAAQALGVDPPRLDDVMHTLDDLGASDLELAWLSHVLDLKPQLTHACEVMFELATKRPDLATRILADKRCDRSQPSHEDRAKLGRALVVKRMFSEAAQLLSDVETWPERTPEHVDGWLELCDADIGLEHWADGRSCLRRLDATGIVPTEREAEIANRLEAIANAPH